MVLSIGSPVPGLPDEHAVVGRSSCKRHGDPDAVDVVRDTPVGLPDMT